jgi:hypothetical protein
VGNLHLRFDEGRVGRATRVALSPTLPVLQAPKDPRPVEAGAPAAAKEPRPSGSRSVSSLGRTNAYRASGPSAKTYDAMFSKVFWLG